MRDTEVSKRLKREYDIPDEDDILMMMDNILQQQIMSASADMMTYLYSIEGRGKVNTWQYEKQCFEQAKEHEEWLKLKWMMEWF